MECKNCKVAEGWLRMIMDGSLAANVTLAKFKS